MRLVSSPKMAKSAPFDWGGMKVQTEKALCSPTEDRAKMVVPESEKTKNQAVRFSSNLLHGQTMSRNTD